MKWIGYLRAAMIIVIVTMNTTFTDKFDSFWYDGKAEISTYQITEMRYGEPRDGIRIMVFVTEPMRLSTHIKPDNQLSYDSIINVIKLNDIRKFNTGIYDYSIMTSVFTAVDEKNTIPEMSTMKISFTSQEWCGNVFEILKRNKKRFNGNSFSYFESEGEQKFNLSTHDNLDTEDNLWIIIRELKNPLLTEGTSKPIRVLPSFWGRRKTHAPVMILEGTLTKGNRKKISTALGKIESIPFEWYLNKKITKVWVEAEYPHRILSWVEPDGSKGSIIASSRETYWKQKSNDDLHLREKLGLLRNSEELL